MTQSAFNSVVASAIAKTLSRLGTGPILVHSDPFRAARLVSAAGGRDVFLDSHLSLLRAASDARPIWMPAFNYDFPRTKSFDLVHDASQLGPITERFRLTAADWRTEIPIFSATGTGAPPRVTWGEAADPFGAESLFARLVEADGIILYYGATFHYNTVVHYSERLAGGVPYRYDKLFPGTVTRVDRSKAAGSLNYHVRPHERGLEYDWPAILVRALDAGVCLKTDGHPEVLAASAGTIAQFFVDELRRDPFALLDADTLRWVEPTLEKLGRPFTIDDFEGPASQPRSSAGAGT